MQEEAEAKEEAEAEEEVEDEVEVDEDNVKAQSHYLLACTSDALRPQQQHQQLCTLSSRATSPMQARQSSAKKRLPRLQTFTPSSLLTSPHSHDAHRTADA